ncbi:MAG: ABC transporter ATP-binding protein [Deltaproteobacteria bacterium]|nr:ABC transporter ATP-binding protein [Deltaproteobacteria bacterium]
MRPNPQFENTGCLLSIKDLRTYFHTSEGVAHAVDGVSYHVDAGETIGVVGESGCGKSVTALSILKLIPMPPGEIVSGQILFEDKDLLQLPLKQMRSIRGNRISMIFQEPMTSLNPVFTIGQQISRVFRIHENLSHRAAREKAAAMLAACEIPTPSQALERYPHELSGGMRQRAMIAMALGCNPALLIADEPTTALDVTIQAQIMDLMSRLQQTLGMAMMLITHDLGVVANAAQRVVVMYAGVKVEEAHADTLFKTPAHPYTAALLKSIPTPGKKVKFLPEIRGIVPAPTRKIVGCKFAERCPEVIPACREERPGLREVETRHWVACIRR